VNLRALAYRVERNISGNLKLSLAENNKLSTGENKEDLVRSISGSSPLSSSDVNINNWGAFGKTCSLDRPCVVDEIHLRRFDGLLVTHLH